jgi:hypothetical protein
MLTDQEYIALYRGLIQKKFMLGNGEGKLKQRELEYIGNLIEEKSKVRLSISTLKRLWKNDLTQLPHPSTLDALVSILDFKDWQEFKTHHASHFNPPDVLSHQTKSSTLIRSLPVIVSLGVIILIAAFFLLQGFNKKEKGVMVSGNVLFTADKTVTAGVPNTVMFRYDLSGVEADSFFIQQSWNPRDKTRIDPEKNYYAATYYTPGFHWARVMANDSILKFVNVHIKTDGWLPLVKYEIRDKKHLYLDAKAIHANGIIRTTPEILSRSNVDLSKDFYLRYYNIRDFEGITSDSFDLETRIKCDNLSLAGRTGTIPCPHMEIMLITEQNVFFVPLTSKGCVSELDMLVGEVYKSGKDNDLSALGTEVYDWQVLQIRNANKKVTIMLNGLPVHELEYKKDFGKIKGIIYTFAGQGSVDFLRLKNLKGELVYADEFE